MKFSLFLGFLLISIASYCQPTWSKIYTFPRASEEGTNVISTTDGGFAVSGKAGGHLIKLDASGNILFRQYYDEIEQALDFL